MSRGVKGDIYKLPAFRQAHADAVRRIGLIPSKADGTSPYGHRHAYGGRLARAKVSGELIQEYMHHRAYESHMVYTRPRQADTAQQSRKLLAVGTRHEIEVSMRDVNSELEQLQLVCESLEIYPETDAPTAVLRRSQLLDAALALDGAQPVCFALSPEDQLRLGNELTRRLARGADPTNPLLGKRKVIEIVDARKSLSAALGIDVKALILNVQPAPVIQRLFGGI